MIDPQFISNQEPQNVISLASQTISLGTIVFYTSDIFEVIPKQGHLNLNEITDFIEVRNTFFKAPYKILYNASTKHNYNYAALKAFAKAAKSNLIAVYTPEDTRHAGFDPLISFSPESAYHYFTDHQEALNWLKSFE